MTLALVWEETGRAARAETQEDKQSRCRAAPGSTLTCPQNLCDRARTYT